MRNELSIDEEQKNIQDSFLHCPHSHQKLCYRIDSRNRRYYVLQCLDCGKSVGRVKNSQATGTESPFDEIFLKRCWQEYLDKMHLLSEQRMEQIRLQNQKEKEEWAIEYKKYLSSPDWKYRRKKVFSRDGYTCQACLEQPATEVHHLTYSHVFNEPLFDLISVCGPCHRSITEMDHDPRRR